MGSHLRLSNLSNRRGFHLDRPAEDSVFLGPGGDFLGFLHGALNLLAFAVLAHVVGEVVGEDHVVSADNLDCLGVSNVLNTVDGSVGDLTAGFHGHSLGKGGHNLKPVLVLDALALAVLNSGVPDVVVPVASVGLKFEGRSIVVANDVHSVGTLHGGTDESYLEGTESHGLAPGCA